MISELVSQKHCNEMAAVVRISLKSKDNGRDVPGGPVVKNLPSNAGDMDLIPGRGTKIHMLQGNVIYVPQVEKACALQWRPSAANTYIKTEKIKIGGNFLTETFKTWIFKNWSIADLQYCVNFCCTTKWFSYICICVYAFFLIFQPWHMTPWPGVEPVPPAELSGAWSPNHWTASEVLHILLKIIFHYGLLDDIKYTSLLYSRTLVFSHSIYNGLHLLTPKSQSIPSSWQPHVCSPKTWIL